MLGNIPEEGLVGRIRDNNGVVVEEIKLVGAADYDQCVVWLETADGHRTLAGLKRAHGNGTEPVGAPDRGGIK